MYEFQLLRNQFAAKKIYACQIVARMSEARDQTEPDRVLRDKEDDRHRRGCCLCSERHRRRSSRGNHGNPSANQIGRQFRQSIEVVLGPPVRDRYVVDFRVAVVFGTTTKSKM